VEYAERCGKAISFDVPRVIYIKHEYLMFPEAGRQRFSDIIKHKAHFELVISL
jgi:hypothetical protein